MIYTIYTHSACLRKTNIDQVKFALVTTPGGGANSVSRPVILKKFFPRTMALKASSLKKMLMELVSVTWRAWLALSFWQPLACIPN